MSEHHAHDDPHATIDTPGATHDPVCGHWVVPEKSHGSSVHEGTTIHFCSASCKRAFEKDPGRFMTRHPASPPARASALHGSAPARRMGFLDKIRPATPRGNVTDPVCHMSVDPKAARGGSSAHEGQTYWFCSPGCKTKFEAEPGKFIGPGAAGGEHHMH